jgi:mRNA interferase MazF
VKRGELYRVVHPTAQDPKQFRVFVVVSRQVLIDSRFSSVVCAPIYSRYDALATQVPVGIEEGLKHDSSIHCDELVSLPKSALTHSIGALSPQKIRALNKALRVALDLPDEAPWPASLS